MPVTRLLDHLACVRWYGADDAAQLLRATLLERRRHAAALRATGRSLPPANTQLQGGAYPVLRQTVCLDSCSGVSSEAVCYDDTVAMGRYEAEREMHGSHAVCTFLFFSQRTCFAVGPGHVCSEEEDPALHTLQSTLARPPHTHPRVRARRRIADHPRHVWRRAHAG